MDYFEPKISASDILQRMNVEDRKFFLVTVHRAENVDSAIRLKSLVDSFATLSKTYGFPIICSFHPRTRNKVEAFGLDVRGEGLRFVDPLGFLDFIRLEQSAFCILSDSGTVQEEACILGVPNVTIRDVTERPETLECGSNILSGADPQRISDAVEMVSCRRGGWTPPQEYLTRGVADTVCRLVLSYRIPDLAETAWQERSALTQS
jgi:UDP-N-acetylglucosamine 2-epimerase (non-hydrolysing)